jgi:hypothetical protein
MWFQRHQTGEYHEQETPTSSIGNCVFCIYAWRMRQGGNPRSNSNPNTNIRSNGNPDANTVSRTHDPTQRLRTYHQSPRLNSDIYSPYSTRLGHGSVRSSCVCIPWVKERGLSPLPGLITRADWTRRVRRAVFKQPLPASQPGQARQPDVQLKVHHKKRRKLLFRSHLYRKCRRFGISVLYILGLAVKILSPFTEQKMKWPA